uniref:Uncharacterized protein n=1 Tax=Trichobilharzia regenti TaxID=157069 RepID=A0AA85J9H1_TRIRE
KQDCEEDWYFPSMNIFVNKNNRPWSILLFITYIIFTFYTMNLALTSVCTPKVYFDWFLLPNDCSYIYDAYSRAWVFVGGLFWLISSLTPFSLLIHEIAVFICSRLQKW